MRGAVDTQPLIAVAGLPREFLDLLNQVGWFLPFLALIMPVSLILFLAIPKLSYLLLLAIQAAALYYSLRALALHLRRSRFATIQIRMAMLSSYLVACFVTNILSVLLLPLIRKLF
jgi:hypothetical protein